MINSKQQLKKVVASVVFVILQSYATYAQTVAAYLPLAIGDKLPKNIILGNVFNYPSDILRLDDFRGKMILLDFWATWCGTCIGGFPKMDAIQSEFGNQLKIIRVNAEQTGDTEEKIDRLFKKRKESAKYSVTLLMSLRTLSCISYFPINMFHTMSGLIRKEQW